MAAFYPKTTADKAKLYLHCMVEIKERIKVIDAAQKMDAPALFICEIGQLQLRFICELIAISCLAAQGDFKTQRAFLEEYRPPKIFKALAKIYPDFFPQPSTRRSGPGKHFLTANAVPGSYGRDEIEEVWRKAGDFLHRTALEKYLKKTFDLPPPKIEEIEDRLGGLILLLENHLIVVSQTDKTGTILNVALNLTSDNVAADYLHVDYATDTITVEGYLSELAKPILELDPEGTAHR